MNRVITFSILLLSISCCHDEGGDPFPYGIANENVNPVTYVFSGRELMGFDVLESGGYNNFGQVHEGCKGTKEEDLKQEIAISTDTITFIDSVAALKVVFINPDVDGGQDYAAKTNGHFWNYGYWGNLLYRITPQLFTEYGEPL